MRTHPGLHIGLTGGIGSGKSTVARLFVERGAFLVDTDAIARTLTMPGGGAIEAIRAAFGAGLINPDGDLDRAGMRDLIFIDAKARARLEGILHPLISEECKRLAEAAAGRTIVFDVPLLAESSHWHWRTRLDRVLVVDCLPETQIARVMRRSGWAHDTVLSVIAQQASRERRRACADAVIHNDSVGLHELAGHVDMLLHHWIPVEQSRESRGARPI